MHDLPILEMHGISKSFRIPESRRDTIREHALALFRPIRRRKITVLQDVSFSLSRGQSLGIMGRNGSGKSTLLKILAGIYQPDSGHVLARAPITPILDLGVGWNPELDAIDNIYLIGTAMGMSLRELARVIEEILDFAEVSDFRHLELKHFSTGMAARLAYSVAFRAVQDVLLLDEIFAVGDVRFRERCYDRYRELQDGGTTIVLVSHDPAQIRRFCQRALLIEKGRIVLDHSGEQVAQAYSGLLHGVDAEPDASKSRAPFSKLRGQERGQT